MLFGIEVLGVLCMVVCRRDFIVYREAGGEPDNVTSNGFEEKVS